MKNHKHKLLAFAVLLSTMCYSQTHQEALIIPDFNKLSEELLTKIKKGEDTHTIEKIIANTSIEFLANNLDTSHKRLAFWINIYNAYIQLILQENPAAYQDRNTFFSKEQIQIAKHTISFAMIEHGLIRKSRLEFGKGYFGKWFPGEFEKKLRVQQPVYNIHFALNCGAKDCPPVAIYNWKRLNEQLKTVTKAYLTNTTHYNDQQNIVTVSPLFNWFEADFGGKKGVLRILAAYNLVPKEKRVTIRYAQYDWTLYLSNYMNL